MAAFYGTPQFRGFDLNSILDPQAGDDVAALLEQGKRKEFLSKTKYPGLKTMSFTPERDYKVETRGPGYEILSPPGAKPAPTPSRAAPVPEKPTWQSAFSDIERAGVTGQNQQSSLASSDADPYAGWQQKLGKAAQIFGNKPAPPKAPEVRFANPGPLRATPITKSLPDPVLFALFGKPI